jgi:hypothetical protein
MLGFYYRVWVDCITRCKLQPANKGSSAVVTMIAMSLAMAWNLALFMAILQRGILGYYFYDLNLSLLPSDIDIVLSFIILYILPPLFVNYLLIFRNKRYERLLTIYPYKYNGKLFIAYFTISLLLPLVLLFIGMIFFR